MALSAEWIVNKIKATDRTVKEGRDSIMITCPFHGGGMERTPSCRVNLDTNTGYPLGFHNCYACGENGPFDKLAKILNIPYKVDKDDTFSLFLSSKKKRELLSEESSFVIDPTYKHFPDWDPSVKFRGMKGKLVHKLGGKLIYTDYGERLYLPVKMFKEEIGGITATLNKNKYGPSYIYTPGPWVKKALYPYDYVERMLQRVKRRVIMVGEGTRDSLNPLGCGIPTVMNCGGVTTWSKVKADYLIALEPKLLILGFDPDEIGEEVTEMALNDLGSEVDVMVLNLPKATKDSKKDLGSLSREELLKLKRKVGL